MFGLNFAHSFNVDVNSKVIHEAPRRHCDGGECMFGFAVAQHREQGQPWLLVGAPEADSGQPGVVKGGAVFKCPPEAPGSCDLIQFDTKGNTLAPTGQQYDKKSGQWFGSLVQSSGENGVVLACAPRYVYYIFMNRMDPVGMCFSAKNNFRQIRAHRPCVESGRELFIFICINLFFFSFSLCHLKFCVPVNRRALPDMCGTRVILKDANPLVHATRLEITLPNFSSIRRVEQENGDIIVKDPVKQV